MLGEVILFVRPIGGAGPDVPPVFMCLVPIQGAFYDPLAYEKHDHYTSSCGSRITACELRREYRIFGTGEADSDSTDKANAALGARAKDIEYNGEYVEYRQNTTRHLRLIGLGTNGEWEYKDRGVECGTE